MAEKRVLTFLTIDDWNRPVFKDEFGNLFGNMDVLFDWGTPGEKVLEKINESMIYYFGQNLDDDPMGTKIDANKIKLQA